MKNFTAVPKYHVRNNLDLSANERLFLIFLLSHKEGYTVSDVQTSDNTGISRSTIPGLREKLIGKGHIVCRSNSNRGFVYDIRLDTLNLPEQSLTSLAGNETNPAIEKMIAAFKTGIQNFRESKYYEKILEKEYIQGKWHLLEYKASPGDMKNISSFVRNNSQDRIDNIIEAFENRLADYLTAKIFDNDFCDYKNGKEITPTISLFLKSPKTLEELLSCDRL
jgi:hypothetical protein